MKTTHILSIVVFSLASLGFSWWSLSAASSNSFGDFSMDKVSDLAVGVPNEDVVDSSPITYDAGAINVLFGRKTTGLTTALDQYLYEGKSTVAGAYQEYDRFGSALAIGDFNCDGVSDLAVGVPGQDVNSQDGAGAVHIFYGALLGLSYSTPLDDFTIDQNWPCIVAAFFAPETGDAFGSALASGDFNNDGCSDLAIGVPGEDYLTTSDVGMVHVLYGWTNGFYLNTCDSIWQSDVQETRELNDHFGAALAVGNFGTDAYDDLVIAAPDEDFTSPDRGQVGVVHVIYGDSNGLLGNFNQLWYQDNPGLEGSSQTDDRFGAALAAGDFDGYGGDDLAIGVPGQVVSGFDKAGAVHVLYSNTGNLTTLNDQVLDQASFYISPDAPRPWTDENFGAALTTGDFNGDSFIDLAVGVPADYQGTAMGAHACGGVNVLYGALGALNTAAAQEWSQFDPTVNGACEDDDEFGAALAAGNFDHNAYADLVVGVPGENNDAGYIQVLYGTSAGITAAGNLLWSQDTDTADGSIDGTAENGDRFGAVLAAVPVLNFQVYLPLTMR